ncbi:protoporphyrinogen oxidase [Elusimicrobium simillimum]|uniref:protoporphyrinogen/coproporphyrinogen oxidase n=1 Tax=Elusimicrobium simillimum TaxID=3143438 RepID=UPI003C6ECB75
MKVKTLIIGAGITGLSAAYHLNKLGKKDYAVVEAAAYPGGLCTSIEHKGFTFDYSGHVIHTQQAYTRDFLKKMLGKNTLIVKRKAFVYCHDTMVPFPFQANLSYLPQEIVSECVTALMAAAKNKKKNFDSFAAWAMATYGEGICKHFMFPYNQKIWQTDLNQLTTDWCNTFVPKTNLEDIVKGAYFKTRASYGYNTHFFYPKTGGIGALADAIAAKTPNILYNTTLLSVDVKNKTAKTSEGDIEFENLINTMPLDKFTAICKGIAPAAKADAKKLKHTKVYVLNLGVDRVIDNLSWAYFPEDKFKFYRVGVQSSFSPAVAPAGASALYVEVAAGQNAKEPDFKALEKEILTSLYSTGIINKEDKILAKLWLTVNPAYAVYNHDRAASVQSILAELKTHNITGIGRYGGWEYSFIERNILDGKEAAQKI